MSERKDLPPEVAGVMKKITKLLKKEAAKHGFEEPKVVCAEIPEKPKRNPRIVWFYDNLEELYTELDNLNSSHLAKYLFWKKFQEAFPNFTVANNWGMCSHPSGVLFGVLCHEIGDEFEHVSKTPRKDWIAAAWPTSKKKGRSTKTK